MKTIRTLLVEDETHTRNVLRKMLEKFCKDVEIIGEAANVTEAVECINQEDPDLVFLDIEMPEESGFALFNYFDEIDFEVIFSTAYSQYAIKAIRMAALDYLVKPIDYQDLQRALERYREKKASKQNSKNQYDLLKSNLTQKPKRIIIPDNDGFLVFDLDKIIRLEAENSYTKFFLTDDQETLVSRGIGNYADLLPSKNFVRIHRSHIINIDHIHRLFKRRQIEIEMADGAVVKVSNNKRDSFLQYFLGD